MMDMVFCGAGEERHTIHVKAAVVIGTLFDQGILLACN